MWQGWRNVCLLQRTQRELRRRGRQRKVAQVVAAVEADNVFQAAKQFAPKTRQTAPTAPRREGGNPNSRRGIPRHSGVLQEALPWPYAIR